MNARDDHGISPAARSALGTLLDTPAPVKVWHLRSKPRHGFAVAFCGASSDWLTDAGDVVDCAKCKVEAIARQIRAERRALSRLGKGPISIREIDHDTRRRLADAGQIALRGAEVRITDAGRARLAEVG